MQSLLQNQLLPPLLWLLRLLAVFPAVKREFQAMSKEEQALFVSLPIQYTDEEVRNSNVYKTYNAMTKEDRIKYLKSGDDCYVPGGKYEVEDDSDNDHR